MTEEAITRIRESYGENQVITGEYDEALSAKCSNGLFVGAKSGNIAAFRGIPFAKPLRKSFRPTHRNSRSD